MQKDATRNALHGGPWRYESDHWYRYHRWRHAQRTHRRHLESAALTDVGPGDGGFVCVPGSHKSNFLQHMPRDVARFERDVAWVVQPTLAAGGDGDVLIFTEALIHGTAIWNADHERRTLLYKYSPPHSSWVKTPYDPGTLSRKPQSQPKKPRRASGACWPRRRWKPMRRSWKRSTDSNQTGRTEIKVRTDTHAQNGSSARPSRRGTGAAPSEPAAVRRSRQIRQVAGGARQQVHHHHG